MRPSVIPPPSAGFQYVLLQLHRKPSLPLWIIFPGVRKMPMVIVSKIYSLLMYGQTRILRLAILALPMGGGVSVSD